MSKQQESPEVEVEARLKEFWRDHRDFDSAWARNILHNLSEFLRFVFKHDALRPAIKLLYTESGVQSPEDWDWDHGGDWTGAGYDLPAAALRELPIFQLALAYQAYAYYGLKLSIEGGSNILDEFLEDLASHPGDDSCFPHEWGGNLTDQLSTAALGRWKLDKNKSLTPDELAALAGVSRKSIMNLIAPGKTSVLQKDAIDGITSESAMRWLSGRSDFRTSIWQHQKEFSRFPDPPLASVVEPLFVPVAADGTWFSPADWNSRDGQYYVGNSDDEQRFVDYWTALDFLARAASPRWRYADTTGRLRIKMATGWERKSREELEKLLSEKSHARTA